ncbi:MAG: M10 family metallopeptidase C-terminal domain-containing protein [Hyphomicrobiaceae bacterium]
MPTVSTSFIGAQAIPNNRVIVTPLEVTRIPTGVAITDMTVGVSILHGSDADLDIALVTPSGLMVDLSSDNGGTGDNYLGTFFRAGGGYPSITSASAPFSGSYLPEQPLQLAYSGQMSGTWGLRVADDELSDPSGFLMGWSLTISYAYNGRVIGSDSAGDNLLGSDFVDRIEGRGGSDVISGFDGNDILLGGDGKDQIDGGDGNDVIIGGRGQDELFGLDGRDDFVYESVADSRVGSSRRDAINDFQHGRDDIDLRPIDADKSRSGNQKFKYIGDDRFSGDGGEVRYRESADGIIVSGDINGDKKADFEIQLSGIDLISKGDFLL